MCLDRELILDKPWKSFMEHGLFFVIPFPGAVSNDPQQEHVFECPSGLCLLQLLDEARFHPPLLELLLSTSPTFFKPL